MDTDLIISFRAKPRNLAKRKNYNYAPAAGFFGCASLRSELHEDFLARSARIYFTRTYPPTYLSTMNFSYRFLSYFFLLYKVNEIVPPPRFCQPFLSTFPRFFTFCRLGGSISMNFPSSKQKVIHTPPLGADNSTYFYLG